MKYVETFEKCYADNLSDMGSHNELPKTVLI